MMNLMSDAPATSATRETFSTGLRSRLELTRWSLAHVVLGVPVLVLVTLLVTGLGTAVIGVGLVLLLVCVPLTERLADVHRTMAERILGTRIESPYAAGPDDSRWQMLTRWAVDPARWRDLMWSIAASTLGWALSWIPLAALLGAIWYLLFPFVWSLTPVGILDVNYGLFTIDTQGETFLEWIWIGVMVGLWWWLTPWVVPARARLDRALLAPSREVLERRMAQISTTREESLDHSAAELRRIERDLHDGAQARLVALGLNLGLAEEMLDRDPAAAARLVAEARAASTSALGDLRSVVRGIHPPVLADRGLVGAVRAVALDLPFPVSVIATLAGRPPAPVESAAYFATVELLANVGKHAHATEVTVEISHDDGVLQIVTTDDGRGGAERTDGGGLAGVARRLAAFDGTMDLVSPAGGPTAITMEIPCALSSPRTTPSSATD